MTHQQYKINLKTSFHFFYSCSIQWKSRTEVSTLSPCARDPTSLESKAALTCRAPPAEGQGPVFNPHTYLRSSKLNRWHLNDYREQWAGGPPSAKWQHLRIGEQLKPKLTFPKEFAHKELDTYFHDVVPNYPEWDMKHTDAAVGLPQPSWGLVTCVFADVLLVSWDDGTSKHRMTTCCRKQIPPVQPQYSIH